MSTSNGDPSAGPQQPSKSQGWTMLIFLLPGRESPYGHLYSRLPISCWLAKNSGSPLYCFVHPGSSTSGLSHGEPSPICWNRTSQAAPAVVWATSSQPAAVGRGLRCEESVCSIPPHASPFMGGEGPIWKESHLKQAI